MAPQFIQWTILTVCGFMEISICLKRVNDEVLYLCTLQYKSFVTVVKPGDRVARIRAQLLHILYEIGREEHQFRLRYNGQFLRDAFFLEDYNLESNAVIHMVPLSKQKDVSIKQVCRAYPGSEFVVGNTLAIKWEKPNEINFSQGFSQKVV